MRTPWIPIALVLIVAGGAVGLARRETERARRRAESAERKLAETTAREGVAASVREQEARKAASFLQSLERKASEYDTLQAEGRDREAVIASLRGELERARRAVEDEKGRREAAEAEAARLRVPATPEKSPPLPPEGPVPEKPPPERASPRESPPAKAPPESPGLGPTAVSDPNQVRKLTDGLNALLAGVGGPETWRVVSADAIEDERLVRAILEARTREGGVAKSFTAAEARFVLQERAGTLAIRLREGEVTYPGKRPLPFPGGAYTVLLVVDPAPFRTSGNPLVAVQ